MPYLYAYKRLGKIHYGKSWDHPVEDRRDAELHAPVVKIKEITQQDYDTIPLETLARLWSE